MMRRVGARFLIVLPVLVAGCGVVDPARPTSQPDTEVFGNLLDVERSSEDPATWTARIKVGTPRAVRSAEEAIGNPTPEVEKGLIATVTVGPETVVVVGDRPAHLEDVDSGTEVVVLPVIGTTRVYGSDDLRLEASTVMDFATYRRWRLPKLGPGNEVEVDDPVMINSSGVEMAPVPVAGGTVLYFSAHLRPPATAEEGWHGALREGLVVPEDGMAAVERSYRSELGKAGWSAPELIRFPGLENAIQVRVTWVGSDETVCLVTVVMAGESPWVGRSTRARATGAWGAPERLDVLGADARDAVFLAGSKTKIVFVSNRGAGAQSDLFLYDPKVEESPLPLEPQICTFGNEWGPRTGPQGELLFCRAERQLIFKGGQVRALRLPGPHRIQFNQAAVSDDGRWLFFCMPTYRLPEFDENIFVSSFADDLSLGDPVPVDDWRP
jgi:hypothetical protein